MQVLVWYLPMLAIMFLVHSATSHAATREYFMAAEDVVWDYAPAGKDLTHDASLPPEVKGRTQRHKTRFVEYTSLEFEKQKPQPVWLGILGPIIRAEVA
ncbi:MAG: Ferroxidase [Nitrospira sp.]|nr:Ferroxidase [Nitrospira sp.]